MQRILREFAVQRNEDKIPVVRSFPLMSLANECAKCHGLKIGKAVDDDDDDDVGNYSVLAMVFPASKEGVKKTKTKEEKTSPLQILRAPQYFLSFMQDMGPTYPPTKNVKTVGIEHRVSVTLSTCTYH
ncbi:hypothetical protein VIGAN_01074400 [Vigna angularis var. angularis]|uniref:CI111 double-psi beta barrel domain-containing protein n=1 Tax=Vigna angularis var. angularis TaxID=157739 RepID=A0A0S3QY60_PHAAN|nr:hypothetical protein VIGAN_01074400 [Vigna angularis var. angularis]